MDARSNRPRIGLLGAALCVALAGWGCSSSSPRTGDAGGDEIAAEVGGETISIAELDARIKDELFASRAGSPAKLYELRSDTLEEMIRERVLEAEAKKRGVPTTAVVELELKDMGPISDADIQAYYEQRFGKNSNVALEQVRGQIETYLKSRRAADVPTRLRDRAGVKVHLVEPRFEVAADGPSKGPETARVTIVEFSDFQCPYCQRAMGTVKQLLEKYPQDVRVVYRHLPLESIHPFARGAAEASVCADQQGRFWDFHDKLFANNRALSPADLARYAQELGLDEAAFQACVSERRSRAKVDSDLGAARSLGISGTPAFIVNGRLLTGAQPAENFYEVIDAELAQPTSGSTAAGAS